MTSWEQKWEHMLQERVQIWNNQQLLLFLIRSGADFAEKFLKTHRESWMESVRAELWEQKQAFCPPRGWSELRLVPAVSSCMQGRRIPHCLLAGACLVLISLPHAAGTQSRPLAHTTDYPESQSPSTNSSRTGPKLPHYYRHQEDYFQTPAGHRPWSLTFLVGENEAV